MVRATEAMSVGIGVEGEEVLYRVEHCSVVSMLRCEEMLKAVPRGSTSVQLSTVSRRILGDCEPVQQAESEKKTRIRV